MSVTDHINSTNALLGCVNTNLAAPAAQWNIVQLKSANPKQLFTEFPDLQLPAAAVYLKNSVYGNNPRRSLKIHVLICVDAMRPEAESELQDLCDRVTALLDEQAIQEAEFRISAEKTVSIDPGILARELVFAVEDH